MVDSGSWYRRGEGFQWPHDGQPWETEHFVVYSDRASSKARQRLAQADNQGLLRAGANPQPRTDLVDTAEPPGALDVALQRLSDDDMVAALEARLDEAAAADRFSGTVLVVKDGDVLFSGAYGLADREREIPNTLETRFRIGSMNKMFTAVAILQLSEAGKIELTAPFGRYLPDYPNRDVATQVTIHQLLTHTGGTGDIFGPEFDTHREELRTLGDYVELYGERDLEFRPGSRFAYSNYGFLLLGVVIEAVSGQGYYDYVAEHIFEPTGMTGTGSLPEDVEVPDRAVGYMDPSGGTDWQPNTDTLPFRGTSAGGGYSTVEDLARFADALSDHELLSADSTELLLEGKQEIGPGVEYAYGFEVRRHEEGYRSVGHNGGAPGMNGDLRIYPESGYVVAVLSNLDPPAAGMVAEYLDARLPLDLAETHKTVGLALWSLLAASLVGFSLMWAFRHWPALATTTGAISEPPKRRRGFVLEVAVSAVLVFGFAALVLYRIAFADLPPHVQKAPGYVAIAAYLVVAIAILLWSVRRWAQQNPATWLLPLLLIVDGVLAVLAIQSIF